MPIEIIEGEKQIYRAQADHAAKAMLPDKMDKMLEGKLRKFYQEEVLEEQSFLYDDSLTVKKFLAEHPAVFHDFRLMKK